MVILKNREEIELMRESALSVSRTLGIIAKEIKPGVTTLYLDKIAEEYIRDNGGVPAFKGMYGFPNTLCMSLNASVVHGIPNDKPLQEGDIISVDCGVIKNGYFGCLSSFLNCTMFQYQIFKFTPKSSSLTLI